MLRSLVLPYKGAADHTPLVGVPNGFAPFGAIQNVRARRAQDGRVTIATRPGARRIGNRIRNAPVQAVCPVAVATSVTGYAVKNLRRWSDTTSRLVAALRGQAWILDSVPSMEQDIDWPLTAAPFNAAANQACSTCCWSPSGDRVAIGVTIAAATSASGQIETAIRVYTAAGVLQASLHIVSASAPRNLRSLVWHGSTIYACVSQFVLAIPDSLSGFTAYEIPNVAGEMEQACVATIDDQAFLFVAFNGVLTAGTYTGGLSGPAITAGEHGRQFRAGVSKWRIESTGLLTRVIYGLQLTPGGDYFESQHNTFRISEQSLRTPHGCQINGIAAGPDGSVFIVRTNAGRGPNAAFPANPALCGLQTVMKIDPEGLAVWEADPGSILEVGDGGFLNDIPTTGTDPPTFSAICVDADGDVFIGGRRNNGASVFKLDGETGGEIWRTNLQATTATHHLRRGGAFIDPTDGNPVFAGDRNNAWTGASGASAHLWKVDGRDTGGSVLWGYDIAENTGAACVAVNAEGQIVYGTGYVT